MKKQSIKDFGSVTFDGEEYVLLEDAFLDNNNRGEGAYFARAIKASESPDDEGYISYYMVEWAISNPETEDGGGACDWDNPERIDGPYGAYDTEEQRFI